MGAMKTGILGCATSVVLFWHQTLKSGHWRTALLAKRPPKRDGAALLSRCHLPPSAARAGILRRRQTDPEQQPAPVTM